MQNMLSQESEDGSIVNSSWALVTMESKAAAEKALSTSSVGGKALRTKHGLTVNPFSKKQVGSSTTAR